MGWFGLPGRTQKTAFEELYSPKQYKDRFEMLWSKETNKKSIAVFKLGDKLCGETILWDYEERELMYKPISWIDSMSEIPKKYHEKLLKNSSDIEIECYKNALKQQEILDIIKEGVTVKVREPLEFTNGESDDTFLYRGNGEFWAVNAKALISMNKKFVANLGFVVLEGGGVI